MLGCRRPQNVAPLWGDGWRLLGNRCGQGTTEYAILVGVLVVIAIVAMGSGAVGQTGRLSELPAAEEAGRVLDEYAARGDCVVARSGWLDLLGRTWGCVIQGEGWVDVCVVGERESGGSEVGVMRMAASGLRGEGGG